jgi:hypothetical protein
MTDSQRAIIGKLVRNRLLRLALSSCGILFCLTLFVRTVAVNVTEPAPVLPFNAPDCRLPCVLGITPGETNLSQAAQLLRSSVPEDQITASRSRVGDVALAVHTVDGTILVSPRTVPGDGRSGKVDWINLQGNVTTMGAMIAAGYVPNTVFTCDFAVGSWNSAAVLLIVFGDKQQIMSLAVVRNRVSPDLALTNLSLVAKDNDYLMQNLFGRGCRAVAKWRGFVSLNKYLTVSTTN